MAALLQRLASGIVLHGQGPTGRALARAVLLLAVFSASTGVSASRIRGKGLSPTTPALRTAGFILTPTVGMPTGGTQVTAILNEEASAMEVDPYFIRCQFGDKIVPAQSFFSVPDSSPVGLPTIGILCQAPAAPAKSTVVVRVTLNGRHFINGPKFTYRVEHAIVV